LTSTPIQTLKATTLEEVDIFLDNKHESMNNSTNSSDYRPRVEQLYLGIIPQPVIPLVITGDVFFGFFNGIINVFPRYSLPQLCRGNITTFYNSVN
jgi:hypothetical protein